ncbi:MAG: hypothetical protein JWP74_664 [Marmoricola sp.]|nr:hypothetical protein [Marmoricola sp.]
MPIPPPSEPCPCGSGATYEECCAALLRNERQAQGPEQLMRSRYTAYAVGDLAHLFRTWHPRTRPAEIAPDEGLAWTGLEVLGAEATSATTGTVEFRASWTYQAQRGVLHELSRFEVRADRWVYVDGDPLPNRR